MPDAKSIWHYRERLTQKRSNRRAIYHIFYQQLEEKSLIAEKEGNCGCHSFKEVPIQLGSREENTKIKSGEKVEGWSTNKHRQKDTDARWTKKNNKSYFGYKNHIKVDAKSKLIKQYIVRSAEIHDSVEFENLLVERDKGQQVYADSAYRSKEMEEMIKKKHMKTKDTKGPIETIR